MERLVEAMIKKEGKIEEKVRRVGERIKEVESWIWERVGE